MIKLDITVHPSFSEPKIQSTEPKPKLPKKWSFPWRINMLAKPKPPVNTKYEPIPPDLPEVFKIYPPVDPDTAFRADHLARPFIRKLVENLHTYGYISSQYSKIMKKTIEKSWDSIYNYYRKKLRERRLKRLKRKQERLAAKKPKGKSLEKLKELQKEHLGKLATPKKLFLPEKIPHNWKPLEDLLAYIDNLAAPKQRRIIPPREIGIVSPNALTYEITETMLKLAQPAAKKHISDTYVLGSVKKSALTAKCTPRIEKLAQPSFSAREAKKHEEDKYDPWVISPNALKYKPTARILELAKPLERD